MKVKKRQRPESKIMAVAINPNHNSDQKQNAGMARKKKNASMARKKKHNSDQKIKSRQ
jgi:hypothetical protein